MEKLLQCIAILIMLQSCAGTTGKHAAMDPLSLASSASLGISGNPADVQTKTQPGLLLAGGGGDVDAAMQWLMERSGGGDVVIIRASGSTGYNEYLFNLTKVNSVETLLINSSELAMNDTVVQIVRNAEALFIAGGDQWNYTQYWMGTRLNDAINYLINKKKVPVGGTSAGLAILGEYFFDAKNGGITSDSALLNPFHPKMSVNKGFIKSKWLKSLVTDSHYSERNRQGRHVVMMATMIERYNVKPMGLGLDEKTAVTIDEKGNIKVFGSGKAWFLLSQSSKAEIMKPNTPMTWSHDGKAIIAYIVPATNKGTHAGNIKRFNKLSSGSPGFFSVENGILKMPVHP